MDKLLAEAKRSAFTIPRFQRDFVWTIGQVKLLVDSIARNYPIGSLLLLAETDPTQPFLRSRPVQAVLNEDSQLSSSTNELQPNSFYVLDGQQRLTSIVRVFLQASPHDVYYFDLQKLRDFSTLPTKTDWIIKRTPNSKQPNRYLRSDAIIDRQRCQVLVEEYLETSDDELRGDRPKQREASAKVNSVFETIRNYSFPYVVIDRSESLEAICRIFETINSTGTRLTTFDLAVARFFPEPDLQTLWDESRHEFPTLTQYEVDGERILQAIALFEAAEHNNAPDATRSVLLNLKKTVVKSRWAEAVKHLVKAYQWAETRGVAPGMFPNEALMVPLAVFFSQIDDKWKRKHPIYQSVLDKWYFSSCLQQGARAASNYRVAEATAELLRWKKDGIPLQAPKVFLTPDNIVRLRSTDSRYRAIMAFLRWQMGKDIWTDEPLQPSDVEDHHIFPAAFAKRHGIDRLLLDSVSNRLLVSKQTNRSLSDRPPQEYLVQLIDASNNQGVQTIRRDLLQKACIVLPENRDDVLKALDVTNAVIFIQDRAEKIYDSLKRILGDALIQSDTEDED